MIERTMKICPQDRDEIATWLSWKTASRWDDMTHITGRMIVPRPQFPLQIIIRWGEGTKTSQAGKSLNAPHLWTVVVPNQEGWDDQIFTRAKILLESLPQKQHLTTLTTAQASALLKRVDNRLSAHSIKRGAVTHLFNQGAPLELISRLAKHAAQTSHNFSITTLGYGASDGQIALALKTQEVTKLL
jgi:hypothetical protein